MNIYNKETQLCPVCNNSLSLTFNVDNEYIGKQCDTCIYRQKLPKIIAKALINCVNYRNVNRKSTEIDENKKNIIERDNCSIVQTNNSLNGSTSNLFSTLKSQNSFSSESTPRSTTNSNNITPVSSARISNFVSSEKVNEFKTNSSPNLSDDYF